jgi:hypothetical protein
MLKRLTLALIFVLTCSLVAGAEVWVSRKGNKYHDPNSRAAQMINPENLIRFNTPQEAEKKGYVPSKVFPTPANRYGR